MKITIDTDVLKSQGLTLEEFVILLYYVQGMTLPIEDTCESLWRKGYLVKEITGYSINSPKIPEIQGMMAMSELVKEKKTTPKALVELAAKILAVYPGGKMPGTQYYYKCTPELLAKRLAVFFAKFPRKETWTDDAIVAATQRYVDSFHGNYKFLQMIKYFVYKTADDKSMESQLMNYLEMEEDGKPDDSWLNRLM